MKTAILQAYADVVLRSGVNLQPGQPLLLRVDIAGRVFAETLARRAYELGASYVHVVYANSRIDLARIEASGGDHLGFVPPFLTGMYEACVEGNWASIAVTGPEDPDIFEGADQARLGAVRKAVSAATRGWLEAISSNRVRWNVCLWPTRLWAEKVLGRAEGREEAIWDVLIPILRLDAADPAGAWLRHDAELKRRAAFLNGSAFDRFHITGPGTDLTVGMPAGARFAAGRGVGADGHPFFPNIPTEEVFGTPDLRRTEGLATCTRPVQVNGTNVEGAWFRFESGRVVEFGADRNAGALGQFLDTDANASYLGEIALVGTDSPIYRSGLVFHNILFDENAAIHIALGNGYTECLEGATGLGRDDLLARGCNVSLVHTDFMIGSDEVSVEGLDASGSPTPILARGRFVI